VRGPRPVPQREAVPMRQHHAEEDRVREAHHGQRRQDLRLRGHHGHEVRVGEDLLGHVEGLAGRARGQHAHAPARGGDRVGAVVEHAGGAVAHARVRDEARGAGRAAHRVRRPPVVTFCLRSVVLVASTFVCFICTAAFHPCHVEPSLSLSLSLFLYASLSLSLFWQIREKGYPFVRLRTVFLLFARFCVLVCFLVFICFYVSCFIRPSPNLMLGKGRSVMNGAIIFCLIVRRIFPSSILRAHPIVKNVVCGQVNFWIKTLDERQENDHRTLSAGNRRQEPDAGEGQVGDERVQGAHPREAQHRLADLDARVEGLKVDDHLAAASVFLTFPKIFIYFVCFAYFIVFVQLKIF